MEEKDRDKIITKLIQDIYPEKKEHEKICLVGFAAKIWRLADTNLENGYKEKYIDIITKKSEYLMSRDPQEKFQKKNELKHLLKKGEEEKDV